MVTLDRVRVSCVIDKSVPSKRFSRNTRNSNTKISILNLYLSISIQYLSLSICIHLYLSISNIYLSISTYIYLYLSKSIFISISIYIYLYLSISIYMGFQDDYITRFLWLKHINSFSIYIYPLAYIYLCICTYMYMYLIIYSFPVITYVKITNF